MRTIDTNHQQIISRSSRRVDMRVRVEDGDGTLQDMTTFKDKDWVIGASWTDNIDADCASATIKLRREMFNDSLAPTMRASRLNLNSIGAYDPLLDLGRRVQIQTRYAADIHADPEAWMLMFDGYIDEIDWAAYTITITARDKLAELMDTFIETEDVYSDAVGNPIEDILDLIVSDYTATAPALYTPTSPMWYITEFVTQKQSVYDQIKLLVDQIGWKVRFKWDSGTSAFRLTLYEPDRALASSMYAFDQDMYVDIPQLNISIKDVRNAVTVKFPDSGNLQADGTPTETAVTRTDAVSIAAYRRRWMGVTEDASSHIDTLAEAQAFADAMLHDLAYPYIGKSVTMPYFAFVELEDLYEFSSNNVHYSEDPLFSVVGYTHTIEEGNITTSMDLHESTVIGRRLSWYYVAAEPGMGPMQTEVTGHVDNLVVVENTLGLDVSWRSTENNTTAYNGSKVKSNTSYEVYVTAPSGSPTSADLVGVTKSTTFYISTNDIDLPAGEPYDIHVRPVTKGIAGTYSVASNKTAKLVGGFALEPQYIAGGGNIEYNGNSNSTEIDWDMDTGAHGTDFMIDDGTNYAGMNSTNGDSFLLML